MTLVPLRDGARVLGIQPRTLQRYCQQGRVRGAMRDPWGRWLVPPRPVIAPAPGKSGRTGRPPRWGKG